MNGLASEQQPQRRFIKAHDADSDGRGLDGIVGMGPLKSRWNRAILPTMESHSGRPGRIVVDEPAKSVQKLPGSMIVTMTPSGPASLASTSEIPRSVSGDRYLDAAILIAAALGGVRSNRISITPSFCTDIIRFHAL